MAVQVVYAALSHRRQQGRCGGAPALGLKGKLRCPALGEVLSASAPMSGMNMKEGESET